MKINLKSKILVSILTLATMLSISTMCFAEDEVVPPVEPAKVYTLEDVKLFDTVMFKGDTYKRTIFGKESVRKTFAEPEYGIITVIRKDKEHSLHINGKGWIAPAQITEKVGTYIEINFKKMDGGLKSAFKVNGEFMKISSENETILSLKDGVLKIGANGTTKINLQTEKGELVSIDAVVNNGVLELNIPDKEFTASLGESGIYLKRADQEIASVTVEGEAKAKLELDNGIAITGSGNATGAIEVKGEEIATATVEGNANAKIGINNGIVISGGGDASGALEIKGQEVIAGEIAGNGTVTANLEGIKAEATISEQLSLIQKIKAKMEQKVTADINIESIGATIEGNASIGDKQILEGGASAEYTYIEDNLNIKADANGHQLINKDVKVVQSIKALIGRLVTAVR